MLAHCPSTTAIAGEVTGGDLDTTVPWTNTAQSLTDDLCARTGARPKTLLCSTPGQSAPWTVVRHRGKCGKPGKTSPPCPLPAQHLCLSNKLIVLDNEEFPPLAGSTQHNPGHRRSASSTTHSNMTGSKQAACSSALLKAAAVSFTPCTKPPTAGSSARPVYSPPASPPSYRTFTQPGPAATTTEDSQHNRSPRLPPTTVIIGDPIRHVKTQSSTTLFP